jgi:hypothetical protein
VKVRREQLNPQVNVQKWLDILSKVIELNETLCKYKIQFENNQLALNNLINNLPFIRLLIKNENSIFDLFSNHQYE